MGLRISVGARLHGRRLGPDPRGVRDLTRLHVSHVFDVRAVVASLGVHLVLGSLHHMLDSRLGLDRLCSRGEICRRGSRALASQARSAVKLAGLETRPLPVYLVGGVLTNNALVRAGLVKTLKKSCAVRIAKPVLSPLFGAAARALGDAGVELTADVVANLANSDSGATMDRSAKL